MSNSYITHRLLFLASSSHFVGLNLCSVVAFVHPPACGSDRWDPLPCPAVTRHLPPGRTTSSPIVLQTPLVNRTLVTIVKVAFASHAWQSSAAALHRQAARHPIAIQRRGFAAPAKTASCRLHQSGTRIATKGFCMQVERRAHA